MVQQPKPTETHSVYGKMEVPYKYAVGAQATQFFTELRDNKKIMGIILFFSNHMFE